MKNIFLFAVVMVLFTGFSFQSPTIKASEFKPWLGNWKGTLSYKDYSSGEMTSIKVEMKLGPIADADKIVYAESYPDEPDHNFSDTLRFSQDGKLINSGVLASKKKSSGNLEFILTSEGEDDGQKSEIKVTYIFSKNSYTRKKEVRHRGQGDYFLRNEYKMTRVQ